MIPLEQGSVFRLRRFCNNAINLPSQSLWNRAVSSVVYCFTVCTRMPVSIPLEQGSVFRPIKDVYQKSETKVSIPLEQGSVFRLIN